VNKHIRRRGGPSGSGGPANVQNIIICMGFFRLDSFLLAEISVLDPLTLWRRNFLLNFSTPVFKM